ncbi:hypothetical protein G6F43_012544 [Rhizopus delemar]|nr:hypothetical protein G6F43_012544 [Rhizopus delemar]
MVLKQAHGGPVGGHFGIDKALDKTRQIGWWFSQTSDITTWVAHCEGCQRKKIWTESTAAPLKPITPS